MRHPRPGPPVARCDATIAVHMMPCEPRPGETMKPACFVAAVMVITVVGCRTDYTPPVSKDRAAKALDRWLADVGLPDAAKGFDKGQQARVTVTEAYGFSHSPDMSFAKLALNGFQYREGGETKTYTGKGLLTLHRQPDRTWVIQRLAFESDRGEILNEFYPPQTIDVEP